jgi:hypothetical protein
MDLDELFSRGVDLAGGFLVKAQLKVDVRPARLPVVQDLMSTLDAAYRDRLVAMSKDIRRIMETADFRKSAGLYITSDGKSRALLVSDLFKAEKVKAQPKANLSGQARAKPGLAQEYQRPAGGVHTPGSRGGKWYRDKSGKIRYGTPPKNEQHSDVSKEELGAHQAHLRPGPYMGRQGADRALVAHLLAHGENYGFDESEMQLMEAWYGGIKLGKDAYLNAFLAGFKMTHEDMEGDLSKLTFDAPDWGLENASYEEAFHAFMAHQDWFGEDLSEEELQAKYDEDVRPVLEETFRKYEALKKDPKIAELHEAALQGAQDKLEQRLDYKLAKSKDALVAVGTVMMTGVDKDGDNVGLSTRVRQTAIGLAALDLVFIPKAGEVGRNKHLKGIVSPNAGMFDKKGPLADPETLKQMSAGQLALAYVGAHLFNTWDSDTRTYVMAGTGEEMRDVLAADKLAFGIVDALMEAKGYDQEDDMYGLHRGLLIDHLNEVLVAAADELSQLNKGLNAPLKKFMDAGMDMLTDSEKAEEIEVDARAVEELNAAALAAQQDDSFEVPKSMADSVVGAALHDKPLPHQINPKTGKPFGLFKHQRQCINWMLTKKRGVVALDAGMGKTACIITMMEKLKEKDPGKKAILFLPPSLMNQWPREIAAYAPGIDKKKILNLSGFSLDERKEILQSDLAKNAEYILLSTGTLSGGGEAEDGVNEAGVIERGLDNDGTGGTDSELTEILKGLDGAVFIDEVHGGGYKTEGSVRHTIAQSVLKDREYAFGLTATPMPNGPMDLFHLTDLFAPGSIGKKDEWEGAFEGVQFDHRINKWVDVDSQRTMEMRARLRPHVMYRLITDPEVVADIGSVMKGKFADPDLGPIRAPDDHPIYKHLMPGGHIDKLSRVLFAKMVMKAERSGDINKLERLVKSRGYLQGMLRDQLQRQACISPELYDPTYKGGSPKIERVVADIVKHFKGGGGTEDTPFILFSSLPGKAFPILKRELIKAGIDPSLIGEINGGKSARERSFEQDMTNQGKRKILLVGTKSGGAGLNLQKKAYRDGFLDNPLNPADKRQAVGRLWRPGQERDVIESNYGMSSPWGQTWDQKTSNRVSAKSALSTSLLSDADLNSDAYATAAQAAIDQLGLEFDETELHEGGVIDAAIAKQARANKDKLWFNTFSNRENNPEAFQALLMKEAEGGSAYITKLAAGLDEDGLLGTTEENQDRGGDDDSLMQHLDPKTQAKLGKEAKGLSEKLDVPEEQRLWDRDYEMDAASTTWMASSTFLEMATHKKDQSRIDAATSRLSRNAQQVKGWYGQLLAESDAATARGDMASADKMKKKATSFRKEMDDVWQWSEAKMKGSNVAKESPAKSKQETKAAEGKASAKPDASKPAQASADGTAEPFPEGRVGRAKWVKEDKAAKPAAEGKPPVAAKPVPSALPGSLSAKNPFKSKKDMLFKLLHEQWSKKPPATEAEAIKHVVALAPQHIEGITKQDLKDPAYAKVFYQHVMKHMKQNKAFEKGKK